MASLELASDTASILIRGTFLPSTMTPKWLGEQGLISAQDVGEAEYELLIPDLSKYTTGWLTCRIQTDVVELACLDLADSERLRDVAVGILRSLPDLQISVMGINRTVHMAISDAEKWHRVGDALVNNPAWEGVLSLPGMKSVTEQGQRDGKYFGYVQVQVEPSNRYPRAIYVSCNDHYDLTIIDKWPESRDEAGKTNRQLDNSKSSDKVGIAISVLNDEWGSSSKRSSAVIDNVAKKAE